MSDKTCPNGNASAAFVHGLADAMNDGIDTFAGFSKCKCKACVAGYHDGRWAAAMVDEQQCEKTIGRLLERIDELECKLAAPPVITAKSETVKFPCVDCGLQPHTIFTMGTVDVCQCTRCNKIAAVV